MKVNLRTNFWIRALFLIVLLDASFTQAQDAKPAATPASALQSFYRSYLIIINDSKDPLKSDRDLMNQYVDRQLLTKLDKQKDSDEDYFTKSQDILDDWIDHIAVVGQKCPGMTCELHVTLGISEKPPYKVDIEMRNTDAGWKITKVTKPRKGG